jgi:3-oxoadipate enol-lactonase
MRTVLLPSGLGLHIRDDGPPGGAALVLAHGLGTDLSLWDKVLPLLPEGLRTIRYDLRGHGRSDCPAPPYSMGAMVRDAEGLLDALGVVDCVFLGLGLGGMVAQGLAVKRLDLVRALVLTGTAAKLGRPAMWQARAEAVRSGGMAAVAEDLLARWFSRDARATGLHKGIRATLLAQNPDGYAGGCAAVAGTDFYTPTSGLRLPVLGIAGTEDRATPPDLARETIELIPGAQMRLLRHAGHLPCIDQPKEFAGAVSGFLHNIGHI